MEVVRGLSAPHFPFSLGGGRREENSHGAGDYRLRGWRGGDDCF
jgi:hypothetical protein